jgi:hypothetical protein
MGLFGVTLSLRPKKGIMGINLDLSKALHPRILDMLAAFMPGIFFEVCVVVGNPVLALSLYRPPLDRAIAIVVAILMAFIIGNFFMLWVRFIQITLNALLRAWYWLLPPLRKEVLMYLLRARGNPPRPSWFASFGFLQRAQREAWDDTPFQDIAHAWQQIAPRLLKHYGIDPPAPSDSDAWTAWSGVLGSFEPEDIRGTIIMLASQATGWSGLAAILFAPSLNNRYFLAFCLFSIFAGLHHGCGVASKLGSPEQSWQIGTARALEELERKLDRKPDSE